MDKAGYVNLEKYQDHLIEQYKLYVEMADKISERRSQANQFYAAALAGLLTVVTPLITTLLSDNPSVSLAAYGATYMAIGFIGTVLCWVWYNNINSYKQLNSGKFKVVHEMEKLLPFACYDVEWEKLGKGEDKGLYYPLTHVELWVPVIIGVPFVLILIFGDLLIFTLLPLIAAVLLIAFLSWLLYSIMVIFGRSRPKIRQSS